MVEVFHCIDLPYGCKNLYYVSFLMGGKMSSTMLILHTKLVMHNNSYRVHYHNVK